MFEFIARIVVSLGILAFSYLTRSPDFDLAWKMAAAVSALGIFSLQLETKGLKNSGVAGIIAVVDACMLAYLLFAMGMADKAGFLVLVPLIYAAAQFDANMIFMSPIASGSLVASFMIFDQSGHPSQWLLFQAGGVLAIGFLCPQRRVEQVYSEVEVPTENGVVLSSSLDALLELRENFRKLRDSYRELERRSRQDRLAVQLFEVKHASDGRFYERLAAALQRILGIQSLAIYTLANIESSLIVRAATGTLSKALSEAVIEVDLRSAPVLMMENAEKAIRALRGQTDESRVCNVLLTSGPKVVGMLCLASSESDLLLGARETAEEIIHFVVAMIQEQDLRDAAARRLRETELLYEASALSQGADTPESLANRIAKDVTELLTLDHLGVHLLKGDRFSTISLEGARADLLPHLRFGHEIGIIGWMKAGFEETVIFDARDGSRCATEDAIKQRVGSYCLIPLGDFANPIGYLTAATHHSGGIDAPQLQTLRAVSAELGRALETMITRAQPAGVTGPQEFGVVLARSKFGHIVTLEPLRMDALIQSYGKPAVSHAMRKYAARLRAKLPSGAALCRRPQGDYLAFLPTQDASTAESWANEASALASMISIRTPDGSARIPLGIKAKVTPFDRQQHGILDRLVA